MDKKVAVIGSGIAGIATAIRLAVRKYEVDVFEANEFPGGKYSEIRSENFRFDAGPSLFTLPRLVNELFEISGKNIQDYLKYERLDLITKYFYEDGTVLNAYSDPEKFANEIEQKTHDSAKSVLKYLNRSRIIYENTADTFIFKPLKKWKTWLNIDIVRALGHLPDFKLLSTVHEANDDHFTDPRVVQLFDRYATYNGSDPYQAPAILNVIPHLEHNIGAYFPKGGMYKIIEALVQLAEELDVKFRFGKTVTQILTVNGNVSGIVVDDEKKKYNLVISNMDIEKTYQYLLRDKKKAIGINKAKSSSAIIFYWGIKEKFSELSLHNIFFSKNYKREFEYIFDRKKLYKDPTVYIFISAKKVPSDAPAGMENWFVMINTPENTGQDWDEIINIARKIVSEKISRMLNKEIASMIISEEIMDPRKLEKRTSATAGALYGSNSNSKISTFLRHQNFSNNINNLYFCGGTVHPGGGIPLCLASAKIVDQLIAEKEK